MTTLNDTGVITGTKDKDYNLTWYVQSCLENALRMETYRHDAEQDGDAELAELFAKAQADSRKGAEIGKRLLAARLPGSTGTQASAAGTASTAHGANQPPTDVMAPNQATERQQ